MARRDEEGVDKENAQVRLAEVAKGEEDVSREPLDYAPPSPPKSTGRIAWLIFGGALLMPPLLVAGYYVLNKLTGFSITD